MFGFAPKQTKKSSAWPTTHIVSHKGLKDKTEEEFEDTFLHWIETNVLSFDRMTVETRHDLILSRITSRIRKKPMGKLFQGGKAPQKDNRTWFGLFC